MKCTEPGAVAADRRRGAFPTKKECLCGPGAYIPATDPMSFPPFVQAASLVAGRPVRSERTLEIRHPYDGRPVGSVTLAGRADTEAALAAALAFKETPSRWQRHQILDRTRQLVEAQREEIARLIASEAGLCLRETRYEAGRAADVLRSGEPVEVEVEEPAPAAGIFVEEREGRRVRAPGAAQPAGEPAHERRLAGAEIAAQPDHGARFRGPREAFAEPFRLRRGCRPMPGHRAPSKCW